jgi:hypothetical protein
MGKSVTPTYRVEYRDNSQPFGAWHSMIWRGKATTTRLESWRIEYNKSFGRAGINFHISQSLGFILHISHARIIRQCTGETVTQTTMPMFEVP